MLFKVSAAGGLSFKIAGDHSQSIPNNIKPCRFEILLGVNLGEIEDISLSQSGQASSTAFPMRITSLSTGRGQNFTSEKFTPA